MFDSLSMIAYNVKNRTDITVPLCPASPANDPAKGTSSRDFSFTDNYPHSTTKSQEAKWDNLQSLQRFVMDC